jgi:hypothetical protein
MDIVAYRFDNDDELKRAIQSLRQEVAPRMKLEYDIVRGSSILVVPLHLQPWVADVLAKDGLRASVIKTAPFGHLDIKERHARRRSLLSKKTA